MSRAFSPGDVVQSNPVTVPASSSFSATLANPSTADPGGGMIVMGATGSISPPEQWDYAAWSANSTATKVPQLGILVRADLPVGEQSWPFDISGGTVSAWAYFAEEWTNLSYAPMLASAQTAAVLSPSSISCGTTSTWAADYAIGVAAVMVFGFASASSGWSPVTWSAGFVEDAASPLSVGTGQGSSSNGDIRLHVARYYGGYQETGPWTTTATFTNGAQTNKQAYACLAVFRAESFDSDLV